jgi:tetratricopeptide (TPR) repeat protein
LTVIAAIRHAKFCYFDVSTGFLKDTVTFGNGAFAVSAITFSPNGKLMATSGEVTPTLWDAELKRPLFPLKGHLGAVNAVIFSPDGGTVATGGNDSTIRLWDVATGQERITFKVEKAVDIVTYSRDGKTLLAAGLDGTVWLRRAARLVLKAERTPPEAPAIPAREPNAADSPWDLYNRASLLRKQGKSKESEAVFNQALTAMKKEFGPLDRGVPVTLNTLANLLTEQGRLSEAENLHREAAEVARKLPLGKDRDELLQWSLGCLRKVLLQQGKLGEVEMSDLDHADFVARRGRWKEAAARLRSMIEADPADSVPYAFLAAILLSREETEEYHKLCQQMASRFAHTTDPAVADRIAKACLIHPAPGVDMKVLAEWADTAVTRGQDHALFPWFKLCKNLAEYRQGHFAEAADWAQKTLASQGDPFERDACAYLVLAMAQMQLKQDGAARIALGKAREIVDGKIPKLDGDDLGALWVDVIIANILMREANELIRERAEPVTDPAKAARP